MQLYKIMKTNSKTVNGSLALVLNLNVLWQIHRSKNRWKFYLKDGVMCYGGKDYVFSKAIGEAEWWDGRTHESIIKIEDSLITKGVLFKNFSVRL